MSHCVNKDKISMHCSRVSSISFVFREERSKRVSFSSEWDLTVSFMIVLIKKIGSSCSDKFVFETIFKMLFNGLFW